MSAWTTSGYGTIRDPSGLAWEATKGRSQEQLALAAVRKLNSHADLLAALECMAEHWPPQQPDSVAFNAYAQARAAITKATNNTTNQKEP